MSQTDTMARESVEVNHTIANTQCKHNADTMQTERRHNACKGEAAGKQRRGLTWRNVEMREEQGPK